MRNSRFARMLVALGACLALAGCASGFGGLGYGPGLSLGVSPGLDLNLAPSSCMLLGSSMPPSVALSTGAAAQVGARMQQVAAIQSEAMLGSSSLPARMESWKRLASGGC